MKILFWIIASGNIAVLLLFFVLGLAAASSSHTSGFAVAGYMLVVPLLLVGGSIFLYLRGGSPLVRAAGFLLQATPLIVLVFLKTVQRAQLSLATDDKGTLTYFRDGPARQISEAIARNDVATVVAVANKSNVNTRGFANRTLLTNALEQLTITPDSLDVLRALLKAGADPNMAADQLPLAIAIQNSEKSGVKPVEILLAAGANPNTKDQFGDPLFFVATGVGSDPAVFKALVDGGVDLKTTDKNGNSVVLSAVQTQNWRLVLALMERGVDWKNVHDVNGLPIKETILQNQRTYGDQPGMVELVAYLNSH